MDVVLSRYILDELLRVLPRMNDRLNWQDYDFIDIVDVFAIEADMVEPLPSADDEVRDAADMPVLGTLLAAKADYLITGDKDLLAISEKYAIITPAEFWRRHGQ